MRLKIRCCPPLTQRRSLVSLAPTLPCSSTTVSSLERACLTAVTVECRSRLYSHTKRRKTPGRRVSQPTTVRQARLRVCARCRSRITSKWQNVRIADRSAHRQRRKLRANEGDDLSTEHRWRLCCIGRMRADPGALVRHAVRPGIAELFSATVDSGHRSRIFEELDVGDTKT